MSNFPKGRSLHLAFLIAGGSYPFLVYFGLRYVSPWVLVTGLLVFLGLRLAFDRRGPLSRQLLPVGLLAGIGVAAAMIGSPRVGLMCYPIFVSLAFACVFGFSLIWPPTIIERIARVGEPNLPPAAIPYLRNVTLIWFVFFLVNAAISTATALAGSLALWTLYNGFIAYILMGALFLGEFAVRHFVRRRSGDAV